MNKQDIQTVLNALQNSQLFVQASSNINVLEGFGQQLDDADEAIALLQAALAEPSEAVYWQWRRKDKPWANEYIFAMELQATTDDSEVRKLFTHPASKPSPLTADEVWKSDAIMAVNASMDVKMNDLMKLVRAIEQAVWEKCRG